MRLRLGLALLMLLLSASPGRPADAPATGAGLFRMDVMGVITDPQTGVPLVFLRAREDKRELFLAVGRFEAQAIALALQGMRVPRPQTHDLMLEALHRLQARVLRAVIVELRQGTYLASLVLDAGGRELVLDARPSDAIALALREESSICAAEVAFIHPSTPEASP
ncbi:MAG: bifunctional nuclease family protein [Acidobacteria bacterium]|nr:MAG: bifunctional nuclease family protein [Acidobacteriota bacterium]